MRPRVVMVLAMLGGATPAPRGASQQPESVRIEHAGVECVAAGLHPEITACFDPDAAVVQARVFFRARADRHWYYVKMAPKGACRSAFLPKPRKSAKAIRYYVESASRDFATTRTEEREAEVRDRSACATPAAAKAVVAVGSLAGGPVAPLGFGAGAISVPAVAGVIGAGVAVGGAVAVGGGDGGGAPSTTARGSSTTLQGGTTTTTAPGSSTTTTTTTSSTLPGQTTTTSTIGTTTTTTTSSTTTTVPACTDQTPPQTAIVLPTNGLVVSLVTPVVATATDDVGVTRVEFLVDGSVFATLTSAPYSVLWNTTSVSNGSHILRTRAFDACTNMTLSSGVTVNVLNLLAAGRGESGLLASELRLPGGAAQLVVGRQAVHFVREGSAALGVPLAQRELWLELTVVAAAGKPGSWRVALPGAAWSARVLAGQALAQEPAAVTLRLEGKPGERAVVVFRAE
jgi:Bacterial Ig domain